MNRPEQEQVRIEALQKIQALGINPFPAAAFETTTNSVEIKAKFDERPEAFTKVSIAGRMMSRRIMGKASFAELKDGEGRIQVYISRDDIAPTEDKTLYNDVFKKLLDIGDIIGIEGFVFKTKVGEITVHAQKLTVLSKSIRPLPIVKTDAEGNVYDSLADTEFRYRRRYVDLIVNEGVKETFIKRTAIFNAARNFLNDSGYIEVETPILQTIHGGASARPFVTQHNALDIPLYLRIANELYLKRLIVGGFDGVFEFAKDFRNEGMDKTHNPEFTQLEFYIAYKDYYWMMDYLERMLSYIAEQVCGNTEVEYQGKKINFAGPYKRVPILDAIKDATGYDLNHMSEDEMRGVCDTLNIDVEGVVGEGKIIDKIFGECCEKSFVQPTFIIDYPKSMSPLTKEHREHSHLTERFELIVNGTELSNAYSELTDPIDQRQRFEDQIRLANQGDDEAMGMDEDFIRSLEYGMPPTSGIGIGMDRLTMFLTNHDTIQEVLLFPQMKPEK